MSESFDVNGWKTPPLPEGKGGRVEWFRVEPGTTKVIRLLDAMPVTHPLHHFGRTPIVCWGNGCEPCQQGNPAQRYQFVRVLERTDERVKVFRMSVKVGGILGEQVLAEHGNPTRYDIAVTRIGVGTKTTRYTFTKVGVETPVDLNGQRVPEWNEIFPPPKKNESKESE